MSRDELCAKSCQHDVTSVESTATGVAIMPQMGLSNLDYRRLTHLEKTNMTIVQLETSRVNGLMLTKLATS